MITDASGQKVQSYSYDSFGNPTQTTAFRNSYLFTGREYDEETGLYYYRARYYDPMLGKFISKDPISFKGGDTNLYRYVGNNVTNYVDPWGLFGDGLSAGGSFWGHSDFTGYDRDFDYVKEDHGKSSPYRQPKRHFRNQFAVMIDLRNAINRCDKSSFERYMHQGQDSFSHFDQNFRWEPNNKKYGHVFQGTRPDMNFDAWLQAEDWTIEMLKKWDEKCGCNK